MEIKYQPFIITYDNQELVQLVYDTRKEAQARVDEINNEDRLDRLGVEGKQNKGEGNWDAISFWSHLRFWLSRV